MARAVGDLVSECGAEAPRDFALKESYNVAPTDDVPIVLERLIDGALRRQLHIARWGLVPRWAKEISVGTRSFNARIESAAEKPTFQDSVHTRRCAVPVDGYYEWKKFGAKTKQPYFVHRGDHAPIFFAGLYGWWKDPSKAPGAGDAWLLSTTVLTAPSPPADSGSPVLRELAGLHDRYPVPMDTDTMAAWLDPTVKDGTQLLDMLRNRAYDAATDWTLEPVGSAVGNVRNNSPELILPQPSLLDG